MFYNLTKKNCIKKGGIEVKKTVVFIYLLIFIISTIIIVKQIRKSKKQESFITMIFATGSSLIFAASSDWIDKILVAIGVITKYDNAAELGGSFNWSYFILGCVLLLVGILMFSFNKRKLYVININGYTSKRLGKRKEFGI